jgi:hypothetical protein
MKRSKSHQEAVEAKDRAEREVLAYHHALSAKLQNTIQRVGSIYEQGDTYVWLIAFSPRMRDAVIVETFKSRNGQPESTRVFWLDDIRDGMRYADWKFQELYGKAQQMQRAEYANAA